MDERDPLARSKLEINQQLTEMSAENARLRKEHLVRMGKGGVVALQCGVAVTICCSVTLV